MKYQPCGSHRDGQEPEAAGDQVEGTGREEESRGSRRHFPGPSHRAWSGKGAGLTCLGTFAQRPPRGSGPSEEEEVEKV